MTQVAAESDVELARNRLIAEHMPMVRFLARQTYRRVPQHVCLQDLVSAGTLGLVDAASKFSVKSQVPFKSYAPIRIKGAILDSLRELDWGPRSLRRQGREVEQAIQVLTARELRSPSDTEVADELGLPLAQYQQLLNNLASSTLGSLQLERSDGNGEQEIDCLLEAPTKSPLSQYLQSKTRETLIAAIDTLPEKERLVLSLYYHEELTMQQVSEVMGITQSRVSQIHSSAIAHLRISLPSDLR